MIKENVEKILKDIPPNVTLVAATKTRSFQEIEPLALSGVKAVGENYVKEASEKKALVTAKFSWHLIGHLQKNKVRLAVSVFDMIETVDSFKIASLIDREAGRIGKTMAVLIEVNSGGERQKNGVDPGEVKKLVDEISCLKNIEIRGLMTMGPNFAEPEDLRLIFRKTKELYDTIKTSYPELNFDHLSMGMSGSYRVAIEEGASIVRVGTAIFGERYRE
ncbi:MAG: YggS family pyridoxal phosphate-dependent enzyme [Candidatus Omnitrophica bacterium]|nr:YggS family pyridoxal phosphate-dependent enzyme [Candidatus Omnitrophota bacterium]